MARLSWLYDANDSSLQAAVERRGAIDLYMMFWVFVYAATGSFIGKNLLTSVLPLQLDQTGTKANARGATYALQGHRGNR